MLDEFETRYNSFIVKSGIDQRENADKVYQVEKSIQRIKNRNENNRYENFDINFHNRVRKYFKNLKNTPNKNCILINADDTIKNISDKILLYVQQNFIQS